MDLIWLLSGTAFFAVTWVLLQLADRLKAED